MPTPPPPRRTGEARLPRRIGAGVQLLPVGPLAGYTFRVYHPGWIRSYMHGEKNMDATLEPDEAAAHALPFLLNDRADEGSLVMVDYEGNEWPW